MKRNKISLSHYKLLTCEMGQLIPLTWYEALPGDTIQHSTSMLLRVAPLLSPIMHAVRIRVHSFFVPNRLLWENWENFITGGPDGNNASAVPVRSLSTVGEGTLEDYFGLPVNTTYTTPLSVSALPFRAYNLIWNEFYRDQDLQSELPVLKTDGADATAFQLQSVNWEKDYFTTARPWEQKGTEVTIPIGDRAPITGLGKPNQVFPATNGTIYETGGSSRVYASYSDTTATGQGHEMAVENDPDNPGYPGIYADLTTSTGMSINELRLALAIQRYQEARAQYGSRYVEYLRYLGIRSSDARLQNPEYLGGGKQVIQFSEVLKTGAGEDPAEPIGTLKGHGIAAMRTARYRRFFEEHGVVLTLLSVIPKTVYTTALHRQWFRTIKEMYFQRELQFIGDQALYNKEVQATHTTPEGTFGYVPRYDDYRYLPSGVSGEFRSILNYWHMARDFSGDVALNSSFLTAVPTKRVYASEITHPLYIMCRHGITARRMVKREASAKTF